MQPGRTNGTTTRSRRGVLADQLDLHRLLVFRTLVNEGTMAKASVRLHITQPAISTHIKTLETVLGVSLFDRIGRRSVVNSVGRVLYENADRVLSVADELRAAMEELRGTSTGALELAASFVAQYHLPRALALFTTSHPYMELSTRIANSDDVERLVLERSADIGFIARPPQVKELASVHLVDDEVVPICSPSHRVLRQTQAAADDLKDESFVVRETGSATRQATNAVLSVNGLFGGVSMELGAQEAVQQVVMQGERLGFVSRRGVATELMAGALVVLDAPRLSAPLRLHAVYLRQRRLTQTQEAFLDLAVRCSDRVDPSVNRG